MAKKTQSRKPVKAKARPTGGGHQGRQARAIGGGHQGPQMLAPLTPSQKKASSVTM